MTFASGAFFVFTALAVALYRLVPKALKGSVLIGASYAFYVSVFPAHALVLLVLTFASYAVCVRIARAQAMQDDEGARRWLGLGVVGVVAVLAAFKYAGMGVETLNAAYSLLGDAGRFVVPSYAAPLGLSYVTFGIVHAMVSVRRGEARLLCLADYTLYVAFFPTIVAGPIKRYPEFARDLTAGGIGSAGSDTVQGLARIVIGLFKKLVLAAIAFPLAAPVLEYSGEHPLKLMLGLYAYAFYIYWDFAGYSDMAIGVGRLFGFRIIENFDRPYLKRDLSAFWRSWHISLTRIVTEYVYYPLGGNRRGWTRTACNTLVAMTVVGIWHGAAWHFVAWGVWHGAGLVVFRAWRSIARALRARSSTLDSALSTRVGGAVSYVFGLAVTFHFVVFGWALFVLPTADALALYGQVFGFVGGALGIG